MFFELLAVLASSTSSSSDDDSSPLSSLECLLLALAPRPRPRPFPFPRPRPLPASFIFSTCCLGEIAGKDSSTAGRFSRADSFAGSISSSNLVFSSSLLSTSFFTFDSENLTSHSLLSPSCCFWISRVFAMASSLLKPQPITSRTTAALLTPGSGNFGSSGAAA